MTVRELEDWGRPIMDLRAWDRRPDLENRYIATSESDESKAYLVREMRILRVPFDESDVVEDETTIHICSCPDFKYRKWYTEEPDEITKPPKCKHLSSMYREHKAQADENQDTLE